MDNKIITADGVNIDVDKHEDEKMCIRDRIYTALFHPCLYVNM